MRKFFLASIFTFMITLSLIKIVYAQTSLVGYWKFDEGFGNIAYDSSSYGNNGTIYYATWVGGKFGKALNFNGTLGYVRVPRIASLEPVSITIEAWIYIEAPQSTAGTIVHKWYSGSGGYALSLEGGNKYRFLVGGVPTTWNTLVSDVDAQTNKWIHVAATFDNSTKEMAIYVDGVKKNKTSSVVIVHATKNLEIGAQWGNQAIFNGTIDEVAIYNGALSEEEINQRYQQGISIKPRIYGKLLNKTNSPVQANITVYQEGTNNVTNFTETDANGNYSVSVPEGKYDIQFNISNFYIKIPSLNVISDVYDILKSVTRYDKDKKISFSIDVEDQKIIQTYSESKPLKVLQDGTELKNVSDLPLKSNTWFYQNDLEKKLYISATSWPAPVCRNNISDCERGENDPNNPYYCLADCTPRCSDGTLYGNCSSNKPKYCDNGNLINKCSLCGCYSGYWTFGCLADDNCNYSQFFNVGFENPEDFQTGTNASVWNSIGTAWVLSVRPDLRFEPTTKIIYNGSQAANLTLTNPSDEGGRRLEILHDFDPRTIKEIWLQTLVYIPNGTPVDGFLDIHRPIYERLWNESGELGFSYEVFQYPIGVVIDGRSGQPTFGKPILDIFICQSTTGVDNNFDGFNDITCGQEIYSTFEIPFGQWLNITSYIYKDMTNGTYRLWFNGTLLADLHPIRTIGIDPERIMALYDDKGPILSYNSIGFSLYTGLPASPKSIYFDEIRISLA